MSEVPLYQVCGRRGRAARGRRRARLRPLAQSRARHFHLLHPPPPDLVCLLVRGVPGGARLPRERALRGGGAPGGEPGGAAWGGPPHPRDSEPACGAQVRCWHGGHHRRGCCVRVAWRDCGRGAGEGNLSILNPTPLTVHAKL